MHERSILRYGFWTIPVSILALTGFTTVTGEIAGGDPAEVVIGERLFMETRFAYSHFNDPKKGDPVMATTQTIGEPLPGPFRGQDMNCRACHLVDEHAETKGAGIRSYSDFARLSPQPKRKIDPSPTRPRNAQSLVNASLPREVGFLLHHDGQFASLEDLVKDTLTGREYGWLPGEYQQAVKHIARIVRHDDGQGEDIEEFGGAYRLSLKGTHASVPAHLRLPARYRIDVDAASDEEILDGIAKLVAAYVADLSFEQNSSGEFNASPYDQFLHKNNLPRKPRQNESASTYSVRLLQAIKNLKQSRFVRDKKMKSHYQEFRFGPVELQGMKIFFSREEGGNCIACHEAPAFTDFQFHNTGVTQHHYDKIHGQGSFQKVKIPTLAERSRNHNKYLPATRQHPNATGHFRSIVKKTKSGFTDLGLWNIYANPDFPAPQAAINDILCQFQKQQQKDDCSKSTLLQNSIARFKTPGLRDLGHSSPYMHNGVFDTLEQVLAFYLTSSSLIKADKLRNAAPEIHQMRLSTEELSPLVAFLRSLNEDYD